MSEKSGHKLSSRKTLSAASDGLAGSPACVTYSMVVVGPIVSFATTPDPPSGVEL